MLGVAVVVVVSYLSGAIPFSYVAGKVFAGIDLREHGSGNLGASNTFRFLGPKIAAGVLLGDIAKGFFARLFCADDRCGSCDAGFVANVSGWFFCGDRSYVLSLCELQRGERGIATTAGVFLALSPAAFAGSFAVWVVVMLVTRIVSVASMVGSIALPPYGISHATFRALTR